MSDGDAAARELFEEHQDLARVVAGWAHRRLPPWFTFAEFHQAALIGLWEAACRYDDTKGASFRTFAWRRLAGATLDVVRERIPWKRVHYLPSDARFGPTTISWEKFIAATDLRGSDGKNRRAGGNRWEPRIDPELSFDDCLWRRWLGRRMRNTTRRQRECLGLLYWRGLGQKEAAKIMGTGPSNVCILHANAIQRLRGKPTTTPGRVRRPPFRA